MMGLLNLMKDIMLHVRKETAIKNSKKNDFYYEVYINLKSYSDSVEKERKENEYMMADDNKDLAVEGLEHVVQLIPQLYKNPYVAENNENLRGTLSKIENQAISDLEYLNSDWEDEFDDSSVEMIDSILDIYKESKRIVAS